VPLSWFDGSLTITLEAALSAATGTYGAWDASLWDTATWGPDIVWTDISSRLRSIHTERKFSRDMQVWEAGRATFELLNQDGYLGPANMSSPYVVAGVTGVRPRRPIRLRIGYGGVTYPVFSGIALDWKESWDPSDAVATVTVPCVDIWERIARFAIPAISPVGAGESTGARVHRILNSAGFTGPRNIAVGRNTVQATDLSKNAGDELTTVVDSEGGALFVDADGTAIFEDQYSLMESSRSNTVQGTFVDANVGGSMSYADVAMSWNAELVKNLVSFTRTGGTVQQVVDLTSQALTEGPQPETRSDLVNADDTQVRNLATFYLARYKDPEYRPKELVLKPRANMAALAPQALGRRVRDLVRVLRQPRAGNYLITRDSHVAGITHDITKDDWTATWDLWSATVYQTYANSRWDVALWDQAAWFF
jgi:hypothetical protein